MHEEDFTVEYEPASQTSTFPPTHLEPAGQSTHAEEEVLPAGDVRVSGQGLLVVVEQKLPTGHTVQVAGPVAKVQSMVPVPVPFTDDNSHVPPPIIS